MAADRKRRRTRPGVHPTRLAGTGLRRARTCPGARSRTPTSHAGLTPAHAHALPCVHRSFTSDSEPYLDRLAAALLYTSLAREPALAGAQQQAASLVMHDLLSHPT